MTYALAAFILICIPVFIVLIGQSDRNRLRAFTALTLLILLEGLPTLGFFYGWPVWNGTVRGFGINFADALAIALIYTRRDVRRNQLFWPLIAFYGFSLFTSIFFSSMWIGTAFAWWQFGRMCLYFAAISGEAHRPEVRQSLLTGLALGLIYQASIVMPQKLSGDVQAPGGFAAQNLFGLVLELSILPLVGAVLSGSKSKLVYVGILAGLICVAGTGSRASIAFTCGAIMLVLLLSLIRHSTPRKRKAMMFSVVALFVAVPLAVSNLNNRFRGETFVTDESTRERFEDAARSMASDYPFGVGANQFVWISIHQEYAARAGVSWRVDERSKPVHNSYLLARAETGWHGQIALFLLLTVPIIFAFRMAFADRRNPAGDLALGCAFAIMANALHYNWEFDFHSASVQYMLYLNIGLISAIYRDSMGKTARSNNEKAIVDPSSVSKKRLVY